MLGKPRALGQWLVFVAALGAVVAIGSRTLNSVIAFLGLGLVFVGSTIALLRIWKERRSPEATTFPSQVSVLPRKWRRWILGEDDDHKA